MSKDLNNGGAGIWRKTLVVLLIVPFLPEIIASATILFAKAKGCTLVQTCTLTPNTSPADVIGQALQTGSDRNVLFGVGLAAIWLAICYFVVLRGWHKAPVRLRLGILICVIFAILPYLWPGIVLGAVTNPFCDLVSTVGVTKCLVYKVDIGRAAYSAAGTWLWSFLGGPIAFVCFLVYLIILSVKARRSHHLSEAA
jgi:hypothetical protein